MIELRSAPSDLEAFAVVVPRVRADCCGRGIGTLVLRQLLAHVAELRFATVSSWVDGKDARSLAFARRHGSEEVDRQVEQVRGRSTSASATSTGASASSSGRPCRESREL